MKQINDLLGDVIPEKKAPETEATEATTLKSNSTEPAENIKTQPLKGQLLQVATVLATYGRISVEDAGCMGIGQNSLSARIYGLRQRGWVIDGSQTEPQDSGYGFIKEKPVYVLKSIGLIDEERASSINRNC